MVSRTEIGHAGRTVDPEMLWERSSMPDNKKTLLFPNM